MIEPTHSASNPGGGDDPEGLGIVGAWAIATAAVALAAFAVLGILWLIPLVDAAVNAD